MLKVIVGVQKSLFMTIKPSSHLAAPKYFSWSENRHFIWNGGFVAFILHSHLSYPVTQYTVRCPAAPSALPAAAPQSHPAHVSSSVTTVLAFIRNQHTQHLDRFGFSKGFIAF